VIFVLVSPTGLSTRKLLALFVAGIPACTPFRLAPGADQVRVTNLAADVSGCKPVGNIKIEKEQNAIFGNQLDLVRNQAIGFGGNAVFVTEGTPKYPETGIAYQCPKAGTR
jgi:hypothetical protein